MAKIRMTVTLDIDTQSWADEYGVEPSEVRADVRAYVQSALYGMPVAPNAVTVA